ncbi:DUF429 domain-containing protein [Actinokineospora fastidiosa]|uniref:DUF429 domain-containing protein n=1 Tax=Actinokineospora fastidiosa TaxID=1816 RepID=A0A918G8B6_9PSEU|nr:DUF429 domain-containing protein [Actinokineospora fastidiosa]GGS24631.1 hypothetical protein GCM10010171_17270 [Actinokineospora fastidiosa]
MRVLGVAAGAAGWVGIAWEETVSAYHAPTIGELVDAADGPRVVAVAMPIGLPDRGHREADVRAAQALGAAVVIAPTRRALTAADRATAAAINRDLDGGAISKQAYDLRPRILEVDRWVRETPHEVVEAHPEVSFAALNGEPLVARKDTWAGARRRHKLLTRAGIHLPDDLGEPGRTATVADVIDAAILTWTARRVVDGEAYSLPEEPEIFDDGLPCAIWV